MNRLAVDVARRFLANRNDVEIRPVSRSFSITVDVYADDEYVGYVKAIPLPEHDLRWECKKVYDRAIEQLPLEQAKVFKVEHARLEPEYRGKGIGTDMYVRLVREAADENGVVVPDYCFDDGWSTEEDAWRVWEGSTFQSQVQVFDDMVAWGG